MYLARWVVASKPGVFGFASHTEWLLVRPESLDAFN